MVVTSITGDHVSLRAAVSAPQLTAAAREALARGDIERAASLVAQIAGRLSPQDKASLLRVRCQLALLGATGGYDAYPELAADARTLAQHEPVLAALSLADAAAMALYRLEEAAATALLTEAGALASDDAAVQRRVSFLAATACTLRGDADAATALPEGHLSPFGDATSTVETAQSIQATVLGLASVERYEEATALSQRAIVAARQVGAAGSLPLFLCLFANSAYFLGDYDAALVAASEAADLATGFDQPAMELFASACAALAHAPRGNHSLLVAAASRARTLLVDCGMEAFGNTLLLAEGLAALGAGDLSRATDRYAELNRCLPDTGRASGVSQWRADWIETLHRAGRHDAARAALDDLAAATGDRPLRWSQAVLARCRGLLADTDWDEHFERAVRLHPGTLSRFELGRTYLLWAERSLAAGRTRQGQQRAAQALDCFTEVSTARWAERARAMTRAEAKVAAPAAASAGRTLVRGFGPLTIVQGNVERIVPGRAGGMLLRYLVAVGDRASVDDAVAALWPDVPPEGGGARLRNVLWRIRRQWGNLVVREGTCLRWAPEVCVDVATFEEQATSALRANDGEAAESAVRWCRGELLPAARFEDWAAAPRERLRRSYVRTLHLAADSASGRGDTDAAIGYLERAIEVDPHDEHHYLLAAEIARDAGRAGVSRRFLDRARTVCDDLGVEPSPDLQRLQSSLAAGDGRSS